MATMTSTDWTPYRRSSDGELIGYLLVTHEGSTPLTIFGYPLAGPSDHDEAEAVLLSRGLACLADLWTATTDDRRELSVLILAAYPDRVELAQADFGSISPDSERLTLAVPTGDRLVPRR